RVQLYHPPSYTRWYTFATTMTYPQIRISAVWIRNERPIKLSVTFSGTAAHVPEIRGSACDDHSYHSVVGFHSLQQEGKMRTHQSNFCVVIVCLVSVLSFAQEPTQQKPATRVLLEVVRNSWDVDRNETLVYLRVYSDGLAEAHSMKNVDFRDIKLERKQLLGNELGALRALLADPATAQLQPEYSRYWGGKDFGFKYDVTSKSPKKQVI